MARTQRIQHLRSNTGSAVPGSGTLHPAEIAINYADKKWFYGDVNGDPLTPPYIATNQDSTYEPGVTVTWASNHANPAYAAYETTIPYLGGIDFAATVISWHTICGWGVETIDGSSRASVLSGNETNNASWTRSGTTITIDVGVAPATLGIVTAEKIGVTEFDGTCLDLYTGYTIGLISGNTFQVTGIATGTTSGSITFCTDHIYTEILGGTAGQMKVRVDRRGVTIDDDVFLTSTDTIFDESGNDRLTAPHLPCTAVNGQTTIQTALNDHESRIDAVEAKTADADRGDITVSSSGTVWTIDSNVVTFSKLQDINVDTLIGRSTAGSGDAAEIPCNAVGRSNLAPTVRVITTDAQTVAVGDGTIIMNPVAIATLNLPVVDSAMIGKVITIKNVSIYTITIDANTTDTIDGALTYSLVSQYESVTLLAAATNTWYIL